MIKIYFNKDKPDRKQEQLTLPERWALYRAMRRFIDPLDVKICTVLLMVMMSLSITFIMFWFVMAKITQGIRVTPSF
ncbi:MAG: hypothetical protein AAGB26_08135 [Planctomycetota bacterium]